MRIHESLVDRYYDPGTGQFLGVDPLVDETGQAYAYAGDDPVNGVDPSGRSSVSSTPAQDGFIGIFLSLDSHSAFSGEAPTLGNDLSLIATDYSAFRECQHVNAGDPNICFAYPGNDALSRYFSQGGTPCLLSQITSDEESGHDRLAGLTALAALGIGVRFSGAGSIQPYEVGTYSELKARSVVGDGLDIHHLPQSSPAQQVIDGYSSADGPAIALPADEHGLIPTIRGVYSGNAQDLLELGIEDLRNFTNAPEESIDQIRALNADAFPDDFDFG